MDGWLIINKPIGVSSTRVGSIIKKIIGRGSKVGHVGTLDPLASGILPMAIGEGTKIIPYVSFETKTYIFTVTWGERRSTDDLEGQVIATSAKRPNIIEIDSILPEFLGSINQVPPLYSAIHINGERAYNLARRGELADMPSRTVMIHELKCLESQGATATFEVKCGPGTYVRSLGRDLAIRLGTEGYISDLQRVQDGKFSIHEAISLEKIQKIAHKSDLVHYIVPISAVLDDIPAVTVSKSQAANLRMGKVVICDEEQCETMLALEEQIPCCIGEIQEGKLVPKRVFNIK
jgi:tRNA pseudouridine55 synthase